jgi:uncharacterized integral membrane protein (TIGR00698 family)
MTAHIAERETTATASPAPGAAHKAPTKVPGLLVAAVLAAAATAVGSVAPLVGTPVAGIILGVVLSRFLRPVEALTSGIHFASRTVLQAAVVMLGFQLSLGQIASVGVSSLPTMLGTLAICLATAFYVGRWLGLDADLRTLIGAGTAICGASAIAAVSPVIRARSSHIAYAISTIFVFNIAAVLVFPPLGHLLGMSQEAFGLFAGTAVNDTSSVVAVAATYGPEAADHAVVVKLVRSLMIIPICVGLGMLIARRDRGAAATDQAPGQRGILHLVPWFLVGFIIAAALNSSGLVPDLAHSTLRFGAVFLTTMALAAIGLTTDVKALRTAGFRPLLLGGILWLTVAGSSLLIQLATR